MYWALALIVAPAVVYAALIVYKRTGYGRTRSRWSDALFDSVMPRYEVQEQHQIHIAAPVDVTWAAARAMNLNQSAVVRTLVRLREVAMGARPSELRKKGGFIEEAQKQGWGLLVEDAGREVIMGSVTQPWEGRVVFRALAAREFAEFAQGDFVKIAWNVRVEENGGGSVLRTETRVMPTDDEARAKFRRYWSFVAPGVVLIRFALLRMIKRASERSGRQGG